MNEKLNNKRENTMKMFQIMAAVFVMSFFQMASAEEKAATPTMPAGVKSDHEIVQSEVLKVFAVDDGGARFRAYLVQWKDYKVIVSDPLGTSDKKEGDKISFLAQKIEIPSAGKNYKILNFIMLDAGAFLDKAPKNYDPEAALENAKNEQERFYALGRAAKNAFTKGNYPVAKKYAEELASLTPKYKKDWNYGNSIQDSNLVLGRLALHDGNVAAAKSFLLEAGKSPGSPQMNSFGPNVSLAKDLLEKGEKDTVIEYLTSCKKFWEMEGGKIDTWIKLIKDGKIPDFGPNLLY